MPLLVSRDREGVIEDGLHVMSHPLADLGFGLALILADAGLLLSWSGSSNQDAAVPAHDDLLDFDRELPSVIAVEAGHRDRSELISSVGPPEVQAVVLVEV